MPHHLQGAVGRADWRARRAVELVPDRASGRDAPLRFFGGSAEVIPARLDTEPGASSEFLRCLSEAERQRAGRFVFERDRRRFIVARARLRHLLATRLAAEPGAIELVDGPQGKPALSQRFSASGLRFNVSHSEDVAVFAFAHGREIGVDVERVRELPDADDIAARFFSRRECAAYRALAPSDRPLGFFSCWTRKEAFIKALGEGLSHPLERFDVSLAPGEPARLLRVGETSGRDCGWVMEGFSPVTGYVAAVVTEQVSTDPFGRPGR